MRIHRPKLLAVLGAVLLAGCLGRVAECNALIRVVNAEQDRIARAATSLDRATPSADEIEGTAAAFERAVPRIAAVRLRDARLRVLSSDFQASMRDFAGQLRAMSAALRDGRVADYNAEVARLGDAQRRFAALVARINGACHP